MKLDLNEAGTFIKSCQITHVSKTLIRADVTLYITEEQAHELIALMNAQMKDPKSDMELIIKC